jgi:hypothetical protein
MKINYSIIIFCFLFFLFGLNSFSQTPNGPGGILNTTGASNLSLWLDANNGTALTGFTVTSWSDLSGNVNTATPPLVVNSPTIVNATINGFPVVRFDGSTSYLTINSSASLNMTQWSFFLVGKVNTNKNYNYFFGKGVDAQENYEFLAYTNPYMHTPIYFTSAGRTFLNTASPTAAVNSYSVWQYDYSVAGGRAVYLDGALNTSDAENHTPQTNASKMRISNEEGTAGRFLDGDIAELIMYDSRLNLAQRIVIWNYLAAKYGLALAANDVYTMDNVANGNYDYNVAGIGQASDGTQQLDSRGTGIVEVNNAGGLANNRFFHWGDDNGLVAANNIVDVPAPVLARFTRVWRVSNGGITSEDIQFDLTGLGAVTASDLRLLIDKNNNGIFSDETVAGGGVVSGFTFVAGSTYKISGVNITDAERFTLGTINPTITPLPIELLNFAATPNNNKVNLNWSTATETNNNYFTVEKSKDGSNYDFVAEVPGAGNSTSVLNYSSVDNAPYEGISYYRLKQTDYNGHSTYSNLEKTDFIPNSTDFSFNVYPNPSTGENINLSVTANKEQEILVVVYDITGRESYSKVIITENNGENVYAFDPSGKLAQGMYIISATSQQNIYSKKLIVK